MDFKFMLQIYAYVLKLWSYSTNADSFCDCFVIRFTE